MLESMEPRDSSHPVPRYSRTFVRNAPKGQRKLSFRAADPLQFAMRGNGKALLLLESINFPCTTAFVCIDSKLALCSFENGLFPRWKINSRKASDRTNWFTVFHDRWRDRVRWTFDIDFIIRRCWKYICIYMHRLWKESLKIIAKNFYSQYRRVEFYLSFEQNIFKRVL